MAGKSKKKAGPKPAAAPDETKQKFREALEAKQARHGEAHLDGGEEPAAQPHGPVDAKRVYRRKTG